MPQNQFTLRQGFSEELDPFPHLKELAFKKSNTIQLNSFVVSPAPEMQIYFVLDGKFEWIINQKLHILYPGDTVVVLPGQEVGGSKGYLEVGALFRLQLHLEKRRSDGRIELGTWSNLSESERLAISKILVLNNLSVLKVKEVVAILQEMRTEILNQEIGYVTRVNHLLDSLLIMIARQSTRQASSRRDFPQTFMKLEHALRQNLGHQWSVEEMAAMVGLGTTAFTEKVKSYTGFTPQHYLISIRIAEAIKMLKQPEKSVTDIALETGFYSSQHFSTTFKKLTGHTPGDFRRNNTTGLQ